jgi:predicted DNA-binding protein YlxM (UPF0122 family)
MMDNIIKGILKLDEALEKAKSSIAQHNGALKQLMKNLKETEGVKTYEEALELFNKYEQQEADLEEEIKEEYNKIKEKWEWD